MAKKYVKLTNSILSNNQIQSYCLAVLQFIDSNASFHFYRHPSHSWEIAQNSVNHNSVATTISITKYCLQRFPWSQHEWVWIHIATQSTLFAIIASLQCTSIHFIPNPFSRRLISRVSYSWWHQFIGLIFYLWPVWVCIQHFGHV